MKPANPDSPGKMAVKTGDRQKLALRRKQFSVCS